MSVSQNLESLICEIESNPNPIDHISWNSQWHDLDYDEINELCSTEGWVYISRFLELLSSDQINLEGVKFIFRCIHSLATTSESYNHPAPLNFDISVISDMLFKQKQSLGDENRETRLEVVSIGVRLLGIMNNPQGIDALIQFIKPNLADGIYELENRVTEFALSSIKSLAIYGSEKYLDQQVRSRVFNGLTSAQRDKISAALLSGHLNDNASELIVYCGCGTDARELRIENVSEYREKRTKLRQRYYAEELTHDEYLRLKELIPREPECKCCSYYTPLSYYCGDCEVFVCERCAKSPEEKELSHKLEALATIKYLECEKTASSVMHFIDSACEDETYFALELMEDFWDTEYMEKIVILANSESAWISMQAIRLIGIHGNKSHVELLLDLLEKFSRLQGRGHRDARDAVETALCDLREHSLDFLIQISAETFHNKGYLRAIDRVIKKISRVAEQRNGSPDDWTNFRRWRSEKGVEEGRDYLPAILTDDAVGKIIERQPITYFELLEVDGIGPYKVEKYGPELLELIRKNQPDIDPSEHKLSPWAIPNEVDEWLKSKLVEINHHEWDEAAEKLDLFKSKNCHTKSKLREIFLLDFADFEDHESLLQILDAKLKHGKDIQKAGKSRGVRYARIVQT